MAFRAIQKRIQSHHGNISTSTKEFPNFFKDCFRDSAVVPGDPDLNFREPVHTPGIGESLDKAVSAAVVVSENMAQLFNTNLDSSHVLFWKT